MLGIIVASKSLRHGREILMVYPHSMYKDYQSYYESVHYNTNISAHSQQQQREKILGYPASVLADLLIPKKEVWDMVFDITIQNLRFIGYPMMLETFYPTNHRGLMRSKSVRLCELVWDQRGETITSFCICFVFKISLKVSPTVKNSLIRFSNALKFEQKRCNFLQKQTIKMKEITGDKQEVLLELVEQSLLAKYIKEIYVNFSNGRSCWMMINNISPCQMQIQQPALFQELLPFHSLLLLDFRQRQKISRLEAQLSYFNSPILLLLVKFFTYPIKSFQDVNIEKEIPFKILYAGAQHLIQWLKAVPIPKITLNSMFVVGDEWQYNQVLLDEYTRIFGVKFGDFYQVVYQFAHPIKLQQVELKGLKGIKLVPLVTWLLRKKIVNDVHYYLFFLVKKSSFRVEIQEIKKYFSVKQDIPFDILREGLTCIDDGSLQFSRLKLVLPFCTGKYQIEEISFKTRLSINQIFECVEFYKRFLKAILL